MNCKETIQNEASKSQQGVWRGCVARLCEHLFLLKPQAGGENFFPNKDARIDTPVFNIFTKNTRRWFNTSEPYEIEYEDRYEPWFLGDRMQTPVRSQLQVPFSAHCTQASCCMD